MIVLSELKLIKLQCDLAFRKTWFFEDEVSHGLIPVLAQCLLGLAPPPAILHNEMNKC